MKSLPRRPSPRAATLAAILAVSPAAAAPKTPPCAGDPTDTPLGPAAVADDLSVTLADGRSLRLAGIDPARATPSAPDLGARARAALAAWLAAPSATAHPLSPMPDRWGRVPALLLREGAPSAAAALVAAGLARAAPESAVRGCLPPLLAAEDRARAAGAGLWADPGSAVLAPGDADGLARQAGGMAEVQGILSLHESRGSFYLALGRDRRGFVGVVSRRDAARFGKAGLDLEDYVGTPVRLRGDLDARFGPRMRVTEPEAVESLEPGSIAEEPTPSIAHRRGGVDPAR